MVTATEPQVEPVRRRIELMPGGQTEFFLDESRHPALMGGSGGGKTFPLITWAFLFALKYRGARILLSEPTFPLVRDVMLVSIRQHFGDTEGSAWTFKERDYNITFYNGSVILLRSALLIHPELLSGLELAAFGMDEVALGNQQASFKFLQARLRQPGFPHQGRVVGTPKGMNWVFRTWAPSPMRKKGYCLHHVKTRENPHLPPEYYDALLDSYGDTPFAQQELEGLFVAYQGLIYSMFSTGASGQVQEPPSCDRFLKVAGGVDFSGGVSPSVIEIYGKRASGRINGIDEFYRIACPVSKLVEAAGEFMVKYGVKVFYCDPSGKEEIAEMRKAGLPVRPAPIKDVNLGIKKLSGLLSRDTVGDYGLTVSASQVYQIAEMYQYHWKERRGTEDFDDEPVPENNHCCDATRYVVTALLKPPPTKPYLMETRLRV